MKFLAPALAALLVLAAPASSFAANVRVAVAPEISAAVGERVTLAATVETTNLTWFRFRVRPPGASQFDLVRDFGPETVLFWAAAEKEGVYEIEVAAQDRVTGEVVTATTPIEVTARVNSGEAAVNPTHHPLVFLYSADPCPAGSSMSVAFADEGGQTTVTQAKSCDGSTTMNFYLAGLRENTAYEAKHRITGPGGGTASVLGPAVPFETGEADHDFAASAVLHPARPGDPNGLLLQASLTQPATVTDLEGRLVWYYDGDINFLTRPEGSGLFMGIREDLQAGPDQQVFRLFDVAGTTLKETNAARVSEQLAARGRRPITGFHHEARLMPGGKFLVLASTEQIMRDVQGEGSVDILGDMILVLDSELQVEWVWDAFDHLDVRRRATLGETCVPQGGGCPPFFQAELANDWLHGNSLQLTPDGNILYSARHQDWLIKIAYGNGQGSGAVLWRLGKDGDFQPVSSDRSPWFSHQHDGGFADANGTLTVFDNGNIRADTDPSAQSRGQVWKIDEAARTATLEVNADLGVYSFALGSAQKLPEGGGLHFNLGWVPGAAGPPSARSVEVDSAGKTTFSLESDRILVYRSFRLKTLYTPPLY